MSPYENTAVRFLSDLGVLQDDDIDTVASAQVDTIVDLMLQKRAINIEDGPKARDLIRRLIKSHGQAKRLRVQMELIQMITGKMNERLSESRVAAKEQKDRVTSGHYPAVTPELLKQGA